MVSRIRLRLQRWLSNHSMHTKLFVAFSSATLAILSIAMFILNVYIGDNYKTQLLHSAGQSIDQARSFLQNYIDNMIYASDLIYYNGDLQRVLASPDFHGDREIAAQYREFLVLNPLFATTELNEVIFRARIFIPDDIAYVNHTQHFAPVSELKARGDYARFQRESSSGKAFFTTPESITRPGYTYPDTIISLLRTIKTVSGAAQPLGVEQISIRVDAIREVLQKTDLSSRGLVYLANRAGVFIGVSDETSALWAELQHTSIRPEAPAQAWESQLLLGSRYLVCQAELPAADWVLVALVPETEILAQSGRIRLVILGVSAGALTVIFGTSYFLSRHYAKRLRRLTERMSSVQRGDWGLRSEEASGDEIGELFRRFDEMTRRLEALMEEQYRSGKAVKSAQFQALQAQINPHFLYNTLDLINWEALDHNAPQIARIAQNLAQFYRISLNRGSQIVTIEDELRHVSAYVEIENRHFENAIQLTIDVPEEVRELSCINIILQPFVENAIMHNLSKDMTIQVCNIAIRARREAQTLLLTVEDDGVGMTREQIASLLVTDGGDLSHGYGVKNIHSRIRLCYGEGYGLSFESAPGQGTRVIIRIPALRPEEARELL